jgi:hypothetical protein
VVSGIELTKMVVVLGFLLLNVFGCLIVVCEIRAST